jgi:trigger factor
VEFNIESSKPYLKTILFTVPRTEVEAQVEEKINEYRKQVAVPGYRPGKAPQSLVRNLLGHSVISEVTEKIVRDSLNEVLKAQNIIPVDSPEITDFNYKDGEDLTFKTDIEVYPSLEVVEYQGLQLKRVQISTGEAEEASALEELRKQHAILTPVERPAQEGDSLVAGMVEIVDGQPVESTRQSGVDIALTGDTFAEFRQALAGRKTGETVEVPMTYPENLRNRELAGKSKTFAITIEAIKEPILPEVDDEFAKQAANVDTVAELQERIKTRLAHAATDETEKAMRSQIRFEMIQRNPFELGPRLLQKTFEDYFQERFNSKPSDLSNEIREILLKDHEEHLRWEIIQQALVRIHALEVKTEDRKQWITEFGEKSGMTYDEALNELRRQKVLTSVGDIIMNERIYGLIQSSATWVEESAPIAE